MRKSKILIVEDDEVVRESLQTKLSQEFEILVAKDGKEGLEIALREKPGLVLTDLRMPNLNGMEMISAIRKSGPWGEKVPLIILSNYDVNEETMRGVVEHEPSFYLIKAKVTPEIIIDKIKEKMALR